MRTTVRLPDDLMRQVKRHAADTHRTLTQVIEEALRLALARPDQTGLPARTTLTTVGGGGLQPGVDLDDSAALLGRMESGRDPYGR